jgi:hypothetical protein
LALRRVRPLGRLIGPSKREARSNARHRHHESKSMP